MTSHKRKPTFVLVVPRFEDIFHSYYAGEIIRGVSLAASRINADFLIHITDRKNHAGWLDSTLMDRRFIDGILFADIDNDLSIVTKAIKRGMPCLLLNNIIEGPINYIAVDNKKAAIGIVNYFISLGHKNIATIAGDTSTQSGLYRREGFKQALKDNNMEIPRNYITYGDFLRTPARIAAKKLLSLENRPTAIFAASDVMALELIDIAREMKIKVPEELSVVGFDNNPLILSSSTELTTVSQPLVEMGRLGAESIYLISKGKAKLPVKEILPTKLIKRQSVQKIS